MKLREHANMKYRGVSSWPPKWEHHTNAGLIKTAEGEIGVLKYVLARRSPAEKCYLVIEHENEAFVGTLFFDNDTTCDPFCKLLRANVGRSIKEIGDLEV